jgi:hypothetical protein
MSGTRPQPSVWYEPVQTLGGRWLAVDQQRMIVTATELIGQIGEHRSYQERLRRSLAEIDERIRQAEEVLAFIEGQAP